MAELPVSILLRSCNEAWALRDTLPALAAQHYRNWELIAFDSGSTDGSVELIRRAQPRHFVQILPHEYRPGRVLNQGMALSRHDRVIFLNADATPQGPDWLEPLVRALDDPQVAAVFGRQIPRPDCAAPVARDYERCFGENRASAGWDHFFSMVSSGLRRDVWARRGFRETLQYSEDDDYTRWCRTAGYRIAYCPASVVMHSHNYTPRQAYQRSFGEAWALAAGGHAAVPEPHPLRAQLLGWMREVAGDLLFCGRTRRLPEWPRATSVRWQQRLGRRHGLQVGQPVARAAPALPARFTLDGDAALERHLALTCAQVADGLRALVPARRLEAVLLGGGYGRGEGGVLRGPDGDRPYNDLDFTVAIQGSRHLNEWRYQRRLDVFGAILTHQADVEIEFKITSLAELAAQPVTMSSYDLGAGHQVVYARDGARVLADCHPHPSAESIPVAEATRLLMNRCSGLLFAHAELERATLSPAAADFVQRNLAKVQLACGDALLTACGRYHWSCRERHERLQRLAADAPWPWFVALVAHHAIGVEFKLHPTREQPTREALRDLHHEVSALARQCWLCLESRRLARAFPSARAYAADARPQCPGTAPLRNFLLNLRANGYRPRMYPNPWHHPRQRIFHALALLLWEPAAATDPTLRRQLARELNTRPLDPPDWLPAYRALWCRVQ